MQLASGATEEEHTDLYRWIDFLIGKSLPLSAASCSRNSRTVTFPKRRTTLLRRKDFGRLYSNWPRLLKGRVLRKNWKMQVVEPLCMTDGHYLLACTITINSCSHSDIAVTQSKYQRYRSCYRKWYHGYSKSNELSVQCTGACLALSWDLYRIIWYRPFGLGKSCYSRQYNNKPKGVPFVGHSPCWVQ